MHEMDPRLKFWGPILIIIAIAFASAMYYREDVRKANQYDQLKEDLHYLLDNYQGALPTMASMDTKANDAYEITYLFTLDLQEILDNYK